MQSDIPSGYIPSGYTKDDFGWLNSHTDTRKIAATFNMQEQMTETRAWRKLRGIGDVKQCRSYGKGKRWWNTYYQNARN